MNKTAVLVFSGYNQRGVIAFCRVLRARTVDFAIIAKSEDDTILHSAYADAVLAVRAVAELDQQDLFDQIGIARSKLKADRYFIAPSTEALNRFLLMHRTAFEALDCIVPLVDQDIYEMVSDKYKFTEYCRAHGLRVPRQIDRLTSFPIVAKPREYGSATSETALYPVIIGDVSAYTDFVARHDEREYFYQEYVGGDSYYLLYWFGRDRRVLSFSQQNLIQQPGGKSIVAAVSSTVHEQPISEQYCRLFQKLGYFGLVMVELKYDRGEYFMIEANPRFWGPSQLFVDAGCTFFEAYLADFGVQIDTGASAFQVADDGVRYCWLGGMMEYPGRELVCHGYGLDAFREDYAQWQAVDIYNRPDTTGVFRGETSCGMQPE